MRSVYTRASAGFSGWIWANLWLATAIAAVVSAAAWLMNWPTTTSVGVMVAGTFLMMLAESNNPPPPSPPDID